MVNDWKKDSTEIKGICQVCGKSSSHKENYGLYEDYVCDYCKELRERDEESIKTPILLDQVIDENHKLALIVGEIGLYNNWLNGDYIKTTAQFDIKKVKGQAKITYNSKTPSPSRLRRIIEELDDFRVKVWDMRKYPKLKGYVCQLHLNKEQTKLKDVFYKIPWDFEVLNNLLTAEDVTGYLKKIPSIPYNREKLVKRIVDILTFRGEKPLEVKVKAKGAIAEIVYAFPDKVVLENETLEVDWEFFFKKYFEAIFYKKPKYKEVGNFVVEKVEVVLIHKVREIYSISDEFMYLVPASQALQIALRLQQDFNTRYQKVSGRLSLQLGLVFADHKYPLYLILDAGKKLLEGFKYSVKANKKIQIYGISAYGIPANLSTIEDEDDAKISKYRIEFSKDMFANEKFDINILNFLDYEGQGVIKDYYYQNFIGDSQVIPGATRIMDYIEKTNVPSDELDYIIEAKIANREMGYDSEEDAKLDPINQKSLDQIHKKQTIFYAPSTVDFVHLKSNLDRINLYHKEAHSLKRNNSISKKYGFIRTRPYLWQRFDNLLNINKRLNNAGITISSLYNLMTLYLSELERFFGKNQADFKSVVLESEENRYLLDRLIITLLTNIGQLKEKLDNANLTTDIIGLLKTGEYFDLMELRALLGSELGGI